MFGVDWHSGYCLAGQCEKTQGHIDNMATMLSIPLHMEIVEIPVNKSGFTRRLCVHVSSFGIR